METNSRKRGRYDSELDSNSPESRRVESATESEPNQPELKRLRYDSVDNLPESDPDPELVGSSEVEHIPEDILDILDDSETVNDRNPAIEDLDSVIKSFEEEILPQPSFSTLGAAAAEAAVDLTSDSGESQPDLGYLFEASDDELGLPPTQSRALANEPPIDLTATNSSGAIELGNMIEFENEFSGYDSFELGLSESTGAVNEEDNNVNSNGDFVAVDGLFDYSEPSDFSGLSWRPESLPAV